MPAVKFYVLRRQESLQDYLSGKYIFIRGCCRLFSTGKYVRKRLVFRLFSFCVFQNVHYGAFELFRKYVYCSSIFAKLCYTPLGYISIKYLMLCIFRTRRCKAGVSIFIKILAVKGTHFLKYEFPVYLNICV